MRLDLLADVLRALDNPTHEMIAEAWAVVKRKNKPWDSFGPGLGFAEAIKAANAKIAARLRAQSSPDAGDGEWRTIESAPLDRTPMLIAVLNKERDSYIVGEAYFDPEHYEGGDWWWAGTSYGEYADSGLSECNHHQPTHWRPLPAPPAPAASSRREGSPPPAVKD